jgi:hypothetical protein
VPDYLFEVWRILFEGYDPPDKQEILRQAKHDLQEEENLRKQQIFNRDRRQLPKLERAKYNWNAK